MRNLLVAVALASLAAVALAPPAHAAPAQRYIVVLHEGANPDVTAGRHAARFGLEVGFVYRSALRGYSAVVPAARVQELRSDPAVALLSEDAEVTTTAQTLPTGINRMQADASTTLSGNGSGAVANVPVAVIDTGIDIDHPDLNVVGGINCSNGRSFDDGNGHGTHVSGTIGAKDDGAGVVGVAPGAPLHAVRVLNQNGSGSWSGVICGIDYVTRNAATIKVANMSLSGTGTDGPCASSALHQAICNSVGAGVTYVVAASNSTRNFSGDVPAAFDQVLTVTAAADFNGAPGGGAASTCRADIDDTSANFSNFTTIGSADAGHTIAAPGVCILSDWKGGGLNTISGTSMASPHVAGAAALCLSTGRCSGTPASVMSKLRADAAAQPAAYGFADDPFRPLGSRFYGHMLYAGGY